MKWRSRLGEPTDGVSRWEPAWSLAVAVLIACSARAIYLRAEDPAFPFSDQQVLILKATDLGDEELWAQLQDAGAVIATESGSSPPAGERQARVWASADRSPPPQSAERWRNATLLSADVTRESACSLNGHPELLIGGCSSKDITGVVRGILRLNGATNIRAEVVPCDLEAR